MSNSQAPAQQRPRITPRPRPAAAPIQKAVAITRRAAPSAPSVAPKRPQASPVHRPDASSAVGFVCPPVEVDFNGIASTKMFNTLAGVRALEAREVGEAHCQRSLQSVRGYSDADLFAIAEIGYAYYRSGGLRLAEVIFDGLTSIKPECAYFHLALGLVRDYLGDKESARTCYRRASELDLRDAHADLNLAELELEAGRFKEAIPLLERARKKAQTDGAAALARKASALLSTIRASR